MCYIYVLHIKTSVFSHVRQYYCGCQIYYVPVSHFVQSSPYYCTFSLFPFILCFHKRPVKNIFKYTSLTIGIIISLGYLHKMEYMDQKIWTYLNLWSIWHQNFLQKSLPVHIFSKVCLLILTFSCKYETHNLSFW